MKVAVVCILLFGLLGDLSVAANHQSEQAQAPRFVVVSIKPVAPGTRSPRGVGPRLVGLRNPGLWQAQGQPLIYVVMAAYQLGLAGERRVVGLPRWCYSTRFDIEARVPAGAKSAQIPLMLQGMLADRFGVRAHWEDRRMRAVAMTVAPGGIKMRRDSACENPDRPLSANPLLASSRGATPDSPGALECDTWSSRRNRGTVTVVVRGITMRQLAEMFASGGASNLPMVDQTHLVGAFDFTLTVPFLNSSGLDFEQREVADLQRQRNLEQAFRRQLGLQVDFSRPSKMPVPVLVVSRAERPSPN